MPQRFAPGSFDAPQFVHVQRASGVSLADLRHDLVARKVEASARLAKAMDAELHQLIELWNQVHEVEQDLHPLTARVAEHLHNGTIHARCVRRCLDGFRLQISKRVDVLQRASSLSLVHRILEALISSQVLLAVPVAPNRCPPTAQLTAFAAHRLLRGSGEFSRLVLLLQRATLLVACRSECSNGSAVHAALLEQLGPCVNKVLTVESPAGGGAPPHEPREVALVDLARGFLEAGAENEAAELVRARCVVPLLLPALKAAAADSDSSLASLADVLLAFIRGRVFVPLLAAEVSMLRPALHLLAKTAWSEWCGFVSGSVAHYFGAGVPRIFHFAHGSIVCSQAWIGALLASRREVRLCNPVTAELRKPFNLPIYFQLRAHEVTRALEAALHGHGSNIEPNDGAAGGTAFHMARGDARFRVPTELVTLVARELARGALRCFDHGVLLPLLASRLLRLVLQCVSRFEAWLASVLPIADVACSPTHGTSLAVRSSPTFEALCQGAVRQLYLDVVVVVRWLRSLLPVACVRFGLPLEHELGQQVRAALLEGVDALSARGDQLRLKLVGTDVQPCAALLAPTRAIAGCFRMTGKKAPTTQSFFVCDVLVSFKASVPRSAFRQPPPVCDAWACDVADALCAHYCSLTSATIGAVHRNEEALRRIVTKKITSPARIGDESDFNKIRAQLSIDVRFFARQLADVGVHAPALRSFVELQDVVRPVGGLFADCIVQGRGGMARRATLPYHHT